MSYRARSLDQFLSAIASAKATPAGGTAAAVVGATGASLCEMVCIHTIETREVADGKSELADIRVDLETRRDSLLDLADADARAVDEMVTDSNDGDRQSVLKRATGVPLAIAEACLAAIEHGVVVAANGNRNALADAVTGVLLARSALQASLFTVRSNLEQIDEVSFVDEMEQRATKIEEAAMSASEEVRTNGQESL